MAVPGEILRLVERFDRNIDAYRSGRYNETQVREEFINPFFLALGWDIYNADGCAEAYKDVIHEDAIRIGSATKAPDYCFRIGGTRKFFLEAKKPSVNIKEDLHPAYQLRRYAWSAKLPLSILTDFEEFAVYDCRIKPVKTDKASMGRTFYFTYRDYSERWDDIAAVFSKRAILEGSFDRYAESTKSKRGTTEVDNAFLQEIERWREILARNIALRNPSLTTRALNFAVQRTIDRIIFLRICEDRGIENYGKLMALQNGTGSYKRLCELFDRADERYNSGLFHFKTERGRFGEPDRMTPNLLIDDRALKEILKNLYYPDSPYEFSVLPADILGQVYERFLGKVIRLTTGHRAVVEEKPEVKKAGGVYYTPTYIVDYIVKETVGKLLEGITPRQAEKLRILDPACGSGSFLIGAYQYLLDWHRDQYVKAEPEKWARGKRPRLFEDRRGDWKLTTAERKRILLTHIFGVDIDSQAVEVTKLSLLLKVLENEDAETINKTKSLFNERALPDLRNNIKCGNSLIGPDFYENGQLNLFNDEEIFRVNAFDWQAEFADIMKDGGFDAVIGNPPYVRIQGMKEWAPLEVEFYKKRYRAASKGNYDIYVVFVERALQLLNKQGRMGYILPHKFFQAQYGEPLRELAAGGEHISEIIHFGDQQVFAGATTYTCLLFLNKAGNDRFRYVEAHDLEGWKNRGAPTNKVEILADKAKVSEWNFVVGQGAALFERLSKMPVKLGNLATNIFQGLVTSTDPVYLLEPLNSEQDGYVQVWSKATGTEHLLESDLIKPLCKGSLDIRRYTVAPSKKVIFPYNSEASSRTGKETLIPAHELEQSFPMTWAYLKENYEILRNREKGKMKHDGWYGYVYPKSLSLFTKCKILTPSIASSASYALDANGELYFVGSGGGGGGGYGIILRNDALISYNFGSSPI